MRKLSTVVALGLVLGLTAVPASAHHDGTPVAPSLRTERVYFKCLGDDKVQTVHYLRRAIPGWDTAPPAGSATDGNGCGHYENLLSTTDGRPNPHDVTWAGTFRGNLDTITVEAHNIYGGSMRVLRPYYISVDLWIDGTNVYTSGDDPLEMTPVPSPTGASEMFRFSFTRIDRKAEHGVGDEEREVMLKLGSWNDTQSIWVWDTTEVPAGLTFNPPTLEPFRIPVR